MNPAYGILPSEAFEDGAHDAWAPRRRHQCMLRALGPDDGYRFTTRAEPPAPTAVELVRASLDRLDRELAGRFAAARPGVEP